MAAARIRNLFSQCRQFLPLPQQHGCFGSFATSKTFTTQCINLVDFFYPIGNTPAVSLTQSLPSKLAAKILLLGCGDLRNILFTAHLDDRPLDITSCDVQKAIIARNVLLLTLINDDVDAKNDTSIWNIYYQMRIDKKSDDLLKAQSSKLAKLSATLDTWKQSKYGSQLRFCDTATLADVRTMWLFYSSGRTKAEASEINKRLDVAINSANKMKKLRTDGPILTGIRAVAPAHSLAINDVDTLHKRYWTHGTLDSMTGQTAKTMLPNRMFLAGHGISTLHYGLDPLLGFHLATAYAPVEPKSPLYNPEKGSDQLKNVVNTARREFAQWAASFRKRAGSITLRFFAGDAIAFAYTLQHVRASGNTTAGFYRDRYHFESLNLVESDCSATASAPLLFDAIDTSNLCDHVGGLNLLTAVSPLLNNNLTATLYTEVLQTASNSRKEVMDTLLCGDTPTVSTLLGLFPAEYWTNASCASYGDEAFLDVRKETQPTSQQSSQPYRGQMFLRVAWKRPPCLSSSADTDVTLVPIGFAEEDLAHILYQIYVRMFKDENMADKLAGPHLNQSMTLDIFNSQPQYHRAGLAAFLRLVQRRVSCDWEKTMRLFINLIGRHTNDPMGTIYSQELFAYLHVLNVHTVDICKQPFLVSGLNTAPAGRDHLASWMNIGPVVCVTLKVPRKYIKAFTDEDRSSFGTPAVHCKLTNGRWANLFPACQFSFGEVSTRGTRHSDGYEVSINEDKAGWSGSSALIVSFYTPSWAILKDYYSTSVSFGLHLTPLMIWKFAKHYGPGLDVYETAINKIDSVYITKHAPNHQIFPTVQGFGLDQVPPIGEIDGKAIQTLTANGDPRTGCLTTVVGRLDVKSEKLRAILKDGAAVKVGNPTPCHSTVKLGQEEPLDLFFPVPILATNQKVRVARKPSYVEVVSQVATVSSSSNFPTSFVYPLYLTGREKVPLAWTMSHLDLEKTPALSIPKASKGNTMNWLNTHFSMQMSRRDLALREDKSIERSLGQKVRLDFKESLFSLFSGFVEIQGFSESGMFGISLPKSSGINILVFPNKLRIDPVTRTVVMDAAILPLHAEIMPMILKFATEVRNIMEIYVDEAELSMWKQVLPSWVERCRTDWDHKDGCEYRATGKIPLTDQEDGAQFLCSCGQGIFPSDFTLADIPGWLSTASKYCTRAAISPMFWAPFADEVYMLSGKGRH
ncbi:MYND finger [Diaporthe helianthi]|uniref:MYND finger n=1 Tax=Diaporthe helianthi TaxID=158607 RepID=A0A2P5HI81_DIAHE|nr:MYND finger [Diaporthe helianthi]